MRRVAGVLVVLGAVLAAVGAVGLALDSGDDPVTTAADEDDGSDSPETSETTEPDESTTTEPAAAPLDVVSALYAELEALAAAGDVEGLLERLHPAVVELYGEEQCRAFLTRFAAAGPEFAVSSATGPDPFDFERDGRTVPVGEAYAAQVTVSVDGQAADPQEAHVADEDGESRWFTDCGDPI